MWRSFYYNRIRIFIFRYIQSESDAEELAEDLFVNLWLNREPINTTRSFNSYLHNIARNTAINFLKKKYLRAIYINDTLVSEHSSTSEEDFPNKKIIVTSKFKASLATVWELLPIPQ